MRRDAIACDVCSAPGARPRSEFALTADVAAWIEQLCSKCANRLRERTARAA